MRIKVATFLFGFVLLGCEKYNHNSDLDYTNSIEVECDLCEWAEGVEGHYVGQDLGAYAFGDSVVIDVEQVFLNHGAYIDSTHVYFKVIIDAYTDGLPNGFPFLNDRDTLRVLDMDGWVYDFEDSHVIKFFRFFDNKIQIYNEYKQVGTTYNIIASKQ